MELAMRNTAGGMDKNGRDGRRHSCRHDGNILASAGWVGDGYDGVHIFDPEGKRIGQILLPEIAATSASAA